MYNTPRTLTAMYFLQRSGTILPILDPSVDTVNEATSDLVTTIFQRYQDDVLSLNLCTPLTAVGVRDYLLHLWAWLDEAGAATGQSFDGSSYQLTTLASSELSKSIAQT